VKKNLDTKYSFTRKVLPRNMLLKICQCFYGIINEMVRGNNKVTQQQAL